MLNNDLCMIRDIIQHRLKLFHGGMQIYSSKKKKCPIDHECAFEKKVVYKDELIMVIPIKLFLHGYILQFLKIIGNPWLQCVYNLRMHTTKIMENEMLSRTKEFGIISHPLSKSMRTQVTNIQ
jgi:hypothetical protein